MSRKQIGAAIGAIVGILILVWGARTYAYARAHESTDNAQVDGRILPVLAKVGGYVQAVSARENEPIGAGALLVAIDDAEYRDRLSQAEAELQVAAASFGANGSTGQSQAMVLTASSNRSALNAQIRSARATAAKADADLARAEGLAKQNIISQAQLDAARALSEAGKANVLAIEEQAGAAGASITSAEAGVRLAQARLRSAQAQRDFAALQLQYARIMAPEAGVVSRKQVEVGQLVSAGQPLLWIVADSGVWVTANFKETQLATMKPGLPAEVDVDAYPGCKLSGKVLSISSATGAKFALLPPDNATGNFTKVVQRIPVRVQVDKLGCGADRPLRPGMSVTAHVTTGN
jgi:membrane fusion protein (multidrug efflux system)